MSLFAQLWADIEAVKLPATRVIWMCGAALIVAGFAVLGLHLAAGLTWTFKGLRTKWRDWRWRRWVERHGIVPDADIASFVLDESWPV